MASIRLFRDEVGEGTLPRVCMRCGKVATCTIRKTFSWHAQWIDTLIFVGLLVCTPLFLVGIVCALAMTLRMAVWVPLCAEHKNYWKWRSVYITGGSILFLILGCVLLTFMVTGPADQKTSDLIGLVCVLPSAIALVWLISAAIIQSTMIRPSEITTDSVRLGRVAKEFVAAVEHGDPTGDRERWRESRRASGQPNEFFDPKKECAREPPPEGIQGTPPEV
jgi:hypothetical protein